MHVAILAGGKGTRLRERLGDLPKPLADIGGRPLIEHQILLAREYGATGITVFLGHGAQAVRSYLGDGERFGAPIQYFEEREPLGTAGAVLSVIEQLPGEFVLLYGDTMLNVDLHRLVGAHRNSGAGATLFIHPNNHPHDSDIVELDAIRSGSSGGLIKAFHPYPHPPDAIYPNLVNAALYVIGRDALLPWKGRRDLPDFGKHLFPAMLESGSPLLGYRSPEYIRDAGTPERLDRVLRDYEKGLIAAGSFATAAPAVFLDRDGTLNEEVNRVKAPEELRLIEGVAQAVSRLNESRFRTVVITNQPVVARGDCTEAQLARIHDKLDTELGKAGAFVDAVYYCPHHPDGGFPGERPELKIACECRKPAPGLIWRAESDMNLDLSKSWMIGDSTVDVRTARTARVRSILVETGHAGRDGRYSGRPDHSFPNLGGAVDFVLARA